MKPHRLDHQTDFEPFRQELLELPLEELIFYTELVMDELNGGERLQFDPEYFCSDFSDRHGRVDFLEAVLREGLIGRDSLFFTFGGGLFKSVGEQSG
ncbi:MAG: hypothetical protein ACLFVQ_00605 [Chitinispirillaceae bacterium]